MFSKKGGKAQVSMGSVMIRGDNVDDSQPNCFHAWRIVKCVLQEMQRKSIPSTREAFFALREELIVEFETDSAVSRTAVPDAD